MSASTSTPERSVDVSDRAAALDRLARLSVLTEFLVELDALSLQEPGYPSYGDDSEQSTAERRELDWLGQLPQDFNPEGSDADPFGEQRALFDALFPHGPGPDAEGISDPDYDVAVARRNVMMARLFLRIAEHPDWLRKRAAELLYDADDGMSGAAAAYAELNEWFKRRQSERSDA